MQLTILTIFVKLKHIILIIAFKTKNINEAKLAADKTVKMF